MNNINSSTLSKAILVIRLSGCASDPVYWYIKTEGEKDYKCGRLDNYTELKNIYLHFNGEVKVLVASRFIIFRAINITRNKFLKNRESLFFSIENLIVGNIENYHAVILKSSKEYCYVMVVEHYLMNLWLGWLTEVGISATVMTPDVLALPFFEDRWIAVKLDNEWLIRDSKVSGFSLDENIFEKLYLSKSLPLYENLVIQIDSQESISRTMHYYESMRIIGNDIENSNANLLSGRYYHFRKVVINNSSCFMIICSCLLLFFAIYLNCFFYKKSILRDINTISTTLSDFYTQYPLAWNYYDSDSIASYNYGNRHSDFIRLLYVSSEYFANAAVSINSIIYDNKTHKISFNINDEGDVVREIKEPHEQDVGLSITKIFNDNGTCEITFEFKL